MQLGRPWKLYRREELLRLLGPPDEQIPIATAEDEHAHSALLHGASRVARAHPIRLAMRWHCDEPQGTSCLAVHASTIDPDADGWYLVQPCPRHVDLAQEYEGC